MAMVRSITITTAIKEDGKEAGAVTGHTVEARVEVGGGGARLRCQQRQSNDYVARGAARERSPSGDLAREPTRDAKSCGRGEGFRAVTTDGMRRRSVLVISALIVAQFPALDSDGGIR